MPTKEKEDYYVNAGRKWIDFLIGFFGIMILGVVMSVAFGILPSLGIVSLGYMTMMPWISMIYPLIIIGLIVLFFAIRRRFVAIGMLSFFGLIILLFLALLGACFLSGPF
jgi:hypothetical protein